MPLQDAPLSRGIVFKLSNARNAFIIQLLADGKYSEFTER